jgi:hypothetical protein
MAMMFREGWAWHALDFDDFVAQRSLDELTLIFGRVGRSTVAGMPIRRWLDGMVSQASRNWLWVGPLTLVAVALPAAALWQYLEWWLVNE